MDKKSSDGNLSRTMGLSAATAIGVGTMVGAGIFVFPGIAGGQAGPGAILSFLLSGLIALIVAACTAELSVTMPKSGGGYFFISRSFGAFLGTIVGIGQWVGLVFASAFYLSGFGEYCLELIAKMHWSKELESMIFALPATVLILVLNIVGTKNVGKFQNIIVISLTFLLILIYSYGFFDVLGVVGETKTFDTFFPTGTGSVFTTAALIFTSYLGFVQISTIAGEVKSPAKNLPRALIGSVLIVIVLYLFVLFVTTSILSVDELKQLGEAATLEVAERLIGEWGVYIVLVSGLLATLSSANASVMSSSRSIFALSKDELITKKASKINKKFQTPHWALFAVSLPIGVLLFRSNLQLFAEIASFLHLIIYASICVTLFKLRIEKPDWFQPSFKVPFGKVLTIIGALSCLALIAFMEVPSILVGSGIVLLSGIYYLIFKRGTTLPAPQVHKSKDYSSVKRLLIPLDLSTERSDPIPRQLIKILRASHVLILGYEKIPEQTDPEQVNDNNIDQMHDRLDKLIGNSEFSKIDIEKEVIHTRNLVESINRVIEEHSCQGILSPRPCRSLKRIVIPVYHPHQLTPRLKNIIEELKSGDKLVDALVVVIDQKKKVAHNPEEWKKKITEQLGEVPVDTDYVEKSANSERKSPSKIMDEITEASDMVVLAESDISKRDSFFRSIHRKVEKAVDSPILTVLREEGY